MDVKIGSQTCGMRQYNVKLAKRNDLYRKIVDLDFPLDLLSEEEKAEEAVTKFRYAELRDRLSTTSEFGFRIEAMNIKGFSKRDYALSNNLEQSLQLCDAFLTDISKAQLDQIIIRLKTFQRCVAKSKFCQTHKLIGSSLLVAFDRDGCSSNQLANVWLIDLFQASKIPLTPLTTPEIICENGGQETKAGGDCLIDPKAVAYQNNKSQSSNINIDVISGSEQLCGLFEKIRDVKFTSITSCTKLS